MSYGPGPCPCCNAVLNERNLSQALEALKRHKQRILDRAELAERRLAAIEELEKRGKLLTYRFPNGWCFVNCDFMASYDAESTPERQTVAEAIDAAMTEQQHGGDL